MQQYSVLYGWSHTRQFGTSFLADKNGSSAFRIRGLQENMNPKIGITLFSKKTREELMKSPKTYLGHKNKVHEFSAGDIILLSDQDMHEFFGLVVLGNYEDGKVYKLHDLLDVDIYSGDAAKYNKYDIKIEKFISISIPFDKLATLCGKEVTDKTTTNIWKNTHLNFSKAFYSGEDSDSVISKLQIIIGMLLSVHTL